MRNTIFFDLIDKHIVEKIYKKARAQEEKLSPDCFTAHYLLHSVIYWFLIFLLFVFGTVCLGAFEKIAFYIFGAGAVISFFVILHYISYRCFVDDNGITTQHFWFFKKQILWKDIKKIEVQEFDWDRAPREKRAVIRNKQNKVVFMCSYELVGFELIVKRAKKERKKKHD